MKMLKVTKQEDVYLHPDKSTKLTDEAVIEVAGMQYPSKADNAIAFEQWEIGVEEESDIVLYETVMHTETKSYVVGDNATLVYKRWGTL